MVGGTGLYLRVLLHGIVEAPGANAALRAQLEEEAAREGRPALHARLQRLDPTSAATIKPTDLVRIIRALELVTLTGVTATEHRARHRFAPDRYPYRLFVLNPPREALYEAINRRTQAMFDAGLLSEVASLVARGYRDAAPMRSVGYTQALAALEGTTPLEEAIEGAAQESRRYAKRQQNWFRTERGAQRISPPYRELEEISRAAR